MATEVSRAKACEILLTLWEPAADHGPIPSQALTAERRAPRDTSQVAKAQLLQEKSCTLLLS